MNKPERTTQIVDVGPLLWTMLVEQAPSFDQYQWPRESARWHELVFCLLREIAGDDVPLVNVRRVTSILASLGLLEIEDLADLATDSPNSHDPEPELMADILCRVGFNEKEATTAVTTLCEAAKSIQERHKGRIQQYLRQYGVAMLNSVQEHFDFTGLSKDSARRAFANWLQNVINMPVSVRSTSVVQFCERYQITMEQLMEAADVRDINVAIVDDLVRAHMSDLNSRELEPPSSKADIPNGGAK